MALGAFFSAGEVIPLTFLTLEAWSFLQLGAVQEAKSRTPFPHFWAVMFLAAVGFWNFLGAGIFGFLVNLPIVSYYEIGTALTANHGHAAMMGVYGMLAVGAGAVLPALYDSRRALVRTRGQNELLVAEHRARLDGLRDALSARILQLYHSVSVGYFDARTLKFIGNPRTRCSNGCASPATLSSSSAGCCQCCIFVGSGVRYQAGRGGRRPANLSMFCSPMWLPRETCVTGLDGEILLATRVQYFSADRGRLPRGGRAPLAPPVRANADGRIPIRRAIRSLDVPEQRETASRRGGLSEPGGFLPGRRACL